jgi:hypothetical protein
VSEVHSLYVYSAAKDCFLVGREAYIAKNYAMSRDWMKEALDKYDAGKWVLWRPLRFWVGHYALVVLCYKELVFCRKEVRVGPSIYLLQHSIPVIVVPAGSGPGFEDVDLIEVYDHLAFSEYQLGNIRKAYQYTKDLLQNGG